MKVYNLQCAQRHAFEGWFGSEAEFDDQRGRGLLECPLCGDKDVARMPSAPRLNLGAAPEPAARAAKSAKADVATVPEVELQKAWLQMVRQVMARTEDVGERFAEEARRIHYGESEERGIRGQCSREETRELLEEGIPVLPLPVPKGLKGPVQ